MVDVVRPSPPALALALAEAEAEAEVSSGRAGRSHGVPQLGQHKVTGWRLPGGIPCTSNGCPGSSRANAKSS